MRSTTTSSVDHGEVLIESTADGCIEVIEPLLIGEVRTLDYERLALLSGLVDGSLLTQLILKLSTVEV